MKRIRVPEEMLKAAQEAALKVHRSSNGHGFLEEFIVISLEAALLWLSENPQVPTDEQLQAMREHLLPDMPKGAEHFTSNDLFMGAVEWQRRCFVQEEPEFWSQERVEKELENAFGILDESFAQWLKKCVAEHYMKPAQIEFVGPEGIVPQAKEPEIPEELKYCLWEDDETLSSKDWDRLFKGQSVSDVIDRHNEQVMNAYKFGLRKKGEQK